MLRVLEELLRLALFDDMACIHEDHPVGDGMTMVCVTHEMAFARAVADRVIFMNAGHIVEQGKPEEFFKNPQHERTKLFLSQILKH